MKPGILNEAFAEFCESRSHLDSLLSKIEAPRKSRVALLLGAFLRRPWALSSHFKIQLASSPEEFWGLGFLKLKKHPGIHAVLQELWEKWEGIPREGDIRDFPPSWVQEWERDWGAEAAKNLARLLSQDPLTTVRFHRRSFQGSQLSKEMGIWLGSSSLPKSRPGNFMASARIFRGFARVQTNELFQRGSFEIQDEGSQAMAAFALFPDRIRSRLSAEPMTIRAPGEAFPADLRSEPQVVIDACAGAGGKTLALADLLAGRGSVFAYDVSDRKIRSLKLRLARARESNVKALTLPEDPSVFLSEHSESADVVLVDAPCGGEGVHRRNPDSKWNRKPLSAAKGTESLGMADLQRRVLSGYSGLVKPGGRLVYGVCTFRREETIGRAEEFLKTHPAFVPEAQGFIGPYDTDGFFMASFRKKQ